MTSIFPFLSGSLYFDNGIATEHNQPKKTFWNISVNRFVLFFFGFFFFFVFGIDSFSLVPKALIEIKL